MYTFSKSLFKFNWTSLIDVPFVVRLVSSTNMLAVEAVKQFGKSFTYIRNSRIGLNLSLAELHSEYDVGLRLPDLFYTFGFYLLNMIWTNLRWYPCSHKVTVLSAKYCGPQCQRLSLILRI